MTYFLHHMEKLVSSISNAESCLLKQCKETGLSISDEIEHIPVFIKDKLLHESAEERSKKRLSSLISFYQSNLIRLIDELSKKECSCSDKTTCHETNLQPLIQKLANTLIFINNQFKDYINHNATLPLICETNHRSIIKERYHILLKNLISHSFSSEMIFIMAHPLSDFMNQNKSSYTYHDKFFLYAWLERLESILLQITNNTEHNDLLCKLMIANNLNSDECIDFFISFITEKYKIEATKTDQLQVLSYFLKCIKQTVIFRKSGYITGKTSLQETLVNWLTLEIDYIKNSCHINERRNKEHKSEISIEKVKTNLTVPQLAALLRISLEVGVFSKEQSKELLRHYSKYFSTIGTINISYDSLYNKFRKPTEVSLETVKDIILNQLKIIQKKEF
ncbi:hypothetical protein [Carboxylicivirga sp. N1Y90]|uniref:hypothetical protein n=1 Tax=Carboxylicivirga fragile TaxID=3417571 RepID=UPI003D3373AD|nr:hypothetical protein [Marinilabiliaceae bacterium N1Y90]